MRAKSGWRIVAALMLALGAPAMAWAQALPAGGEFQANVTNFGQQNSPDVCHSPAGLKQILGRRGAGRN
jgi:hypothetical protein